MISVPHSVDDITPTWLTGVLRENRTISKAAVTELDVQPTGEGQGLGGAISRLRVSYDRPDDALPEMFVAKFHHSERHKRLATNSFGQYEREYRFYRELAPAIGIRTPKCYYAGYEKDSGYFVTLLADLGELRSVDQAEDCSLEDASAVVESLVELHARWWGSEQLDRYGWILDPADPLSSAQAQERYISATVRFLDLVGDYLPPGVESIIEQFGPNFVRVMTATGKTPRTLNHGDFRLGNLFFDDTADAEKRVIAFDWPAICKRRAPGDLAYFICVGFTTESRRRYEDQLLDQYYSGLTNHGISDYSWEEFTIDYRTALLRNLTNFVPGIATMGDEVLALRDGRERVIVMCERFQTLVDWDCAAVFG